MQKEYIDSAAAILCGGKSSRMGFDKAFLQWGDGLLLGQLVEQMQVKFPEILLVSNTCEKFEPYTNIPPAAKVVEDRYDEMGPLGGICTALEESDKEYVFVMACDMPFLNMQLVEQLYLAREGKQVVLFEREGRLETLFALYHRSCLPVFQRQLQNGMRQIRKNFNLLEVCTILLPENEQLSFTNINTKEDIQKWKNQNDCADKI